MFTAKTKGVRNSTERFLALTDYEKIQNTVNYIHRQNKMMQIIHPNQIINTHALSFCMPYLPPNQPLVTLCGGKTLASTQPLCRLYTPAYLTQLECGKNRAMTTLSPTLSSLLSFPVAQSSFFLLPSFQFSKLHLANKLKKISDPSECRELF